MPFTYASRTALKARLQDALAADDTIYRSVLEAVARQIDLHTRHRFQAFLGTRYFSPIQSTRCVLWPGLLSVTTLKADQDGDRTYEQTWLTTDYDLLPPNALADGIPYAELGLAPRGTKAFPILVRGIEVDGKWGYVEDLFTSPSVLTAGVNSSVTTIPVTAGTDFEVLQTILVDSEQMYVIAIASNNLTVERAVNGTVAASHLVNAVVKIYRYPGPVIEATLIQAVRILRRKDAPFGVVGGTDIAVARTIPALDPDVKMLLAPYLRLVAAYA